MMAAMRSRSLLDKIDFGVRRKTSMKSASVLGVYLGVGREGFCSRYFSRRGSRNLVIFCKKLNHML